MQAHWSEVQSLISTFRRDGEREQREAIERMRDHANVALPILRESIRYSRSAHERAWCATAVAALAGRRAIPDLVAALDDPTMSVRLHAIRALVELGDPDVGRRMIPLVSDASGAVRANAIGALTRLGVAAAGREILARTTDEKWYVRQRVARAIHRLRIESGRRTLKSLMADPHPAVRNEAA